MAQSPTPKPTHDYGVAGTNGVYVIIDESGKISYFDGSQKQVNGGGTLPPPPGGKVVGPVNVACSTLGSGEGCVAVDAAGNVWIGPARAGSPYVFVTKLT
jgi:hypothetical protein